MIKHFLIRALSILCLILLVTGISLMDKPILSYSEQGEFTRSTRIAADNPQQLPRLASPVMTKQVCYVEEFEIPRGYSSESERNEANPKDFQDRLSGSIWITGPRVLY